MLKFPNNIITIVSYSSKAEVQVLALCQSKEPKSVGYDVLHVLQKIFCNSNQCFTVQVNWVEKRKVEMTSLDQTMAWDHTQWFQTYCKPFALTLSGIFGLRRMYPHAMMLLKKTLLHSPN